MAGCGKTALRFVPRPCPIPSADANQLHDCRTPEVTLLQFPRSRRRHRQTGSHLFSLVLLAQISTKLPHLPAQLQELYNHRYKGQHKAATRDLKVVLSTILKNLGELFIVVDALDICPPDGRREGLLELIAEITAWGLAGLHLLVSSRPEPDSEETLTPLLTTPAIPYTGTECGVRY